MKLILQFVARVPLGRPLNQRRENHKLDAGLQWRLMNNCGMISCWSRTRQNVLLKSMH